MRRDDMNHHLDKKHDGLDVQIWVEIVAVLIWRMKRDGEWTEEDEVREVWEYEESVKTFVEEDDDVLDLGLKNWAYRYVYSH